MPYVLLNAPDPLTERSLTRPLQEGVTLAISAQFHRLYREIANYVDGSSTGRSFLISGHRGSGKTTLVAGVIDLLLREARDGQVPLRPMYVRLHGPDLLPDSIPANVKDQPKSANATVMQVDIGLPGSDPDSTKPADAAAAADNGKPSADKPAGQCDPQTDNVIRQIAVALYHAAAAEFARAYRDRVLARKDELKREQFSEFLEIAAQLSFDLETCPTLSRLREYWQRGNLLRGGALFARASDNNPDQGYLELVTFAMACQAYQIVSGKWDEVRKENAARKRSDSTTLATALEVKNLLGPLFTVISGGAVGAMVLKSLDNPLAAVLAGIGSAAAVSLGFNWSSTRSRDQSVELQNTFSRDRTVGALGRMLPLLVDHFRRIGLMPIFVVDELDKVDHLSDRMRTLVRYLKYFVTEKAFFCFLTDRNYMERVEQLSLSNTYAQEYTSFTDRLFVSYTPRDLREYLGRIFQHVDPASNDVPSVDLPVLYYALLHRSRLHPFDLRREIARITNAERRIMIGGKPLRDDLVLRFECLIQVAVEIALSGEEVLSRMAGDSRFAQLAFDSVYFPSRNWQTGNGTLDVSESVFLNYLSARMKPARATLDEDTSTEHPASAGPGRNGSGPAQPQPQAPAQSAVAPDEAQLPPAEDGGVNAAAAPQAANPASAVQDDGYAQKLLNDDDRKLLLGAMHSVVRYLFDHDELLDRAKALMTTPEEMAVIPALPTGDKYRLLDYISNDQYRWRYTPAGMLSSQLGTEVFTENLAWDTTVIFLADEFVRQMSDQRLDLEKLAAYRILNTTPSWAAFESAIHHLDAARAQKRAASGPKFNYSDLRKAADCVWEFASNLRASADLLVLAIVTGTAVSVALEGAPSEGVALRGLRLVAEWLGFKGADDDTRRRLSAIFQSWADLVNSPALVTQLNEVAAEALAENKAWKNHAAALLQQCQSVQSPPVPVLQSRGVEIWKDRFSRYFRSGDTSSDFLLSDFIYTGLLRGLNPNLDKISASRWSALLLDAARSRENVWAAVPALWQLGFPELAADVALSKALLSSPDQGLLRNWANDFQFTSQVAASHRAIILCANQSICDEWTLLPKCAAVICEPVAVSSLEGVMSLVSPADFAFSACFAELEEQDPKELTTLLRRKPAEMFPGPLQIGSQTLQSLPWTYIVPVTPAESSEPLPHYIVAPKNLNDLFEGSITKAAAA